MGAECPKGPNRGRPVAEKNRKKKRAKRGGVCMAPERGAMTLTKKTNKQKMLAFEGVKKDHVILRGGG